MRVAFLGNDPWSVPSLESLAASRHGVAAVLTRAPRPAGRGRKPRPTAVAEAARSLGLPLHEVETVKGGRGLAALEAARPDVMVVVAYGEILPGEVLAIPSAAPVNVHFSLLPALRGANPVARAILAGLDRTGVTTMRMDEGMDTGPVLLQAEEPIHSRDDAGALGWRLARVGGRLLVETLDRLEAGDAEERPQDHASATVAKRFSPEEEWIDWAEPGEAVDRRVRALAPEPGARARAAGRVVKVLKASPVEGRGTPGTVLEAGKERLVVAAGDRAVALEEVIPEGRRRMTGAEFARGQRLRPGEPLEGAR
ncbi:MAG TPA: methionyl-tRNA formyltransferase [Actinomycetota bacterium]|nr:methionyl-tRNA formyltransferase [Actinomycetota bacterium]